MSPFCWFGQQNIFCSVRGEDCFYVSLASRGGLAVGKRRERRVKVAGEHLVS